MDFSSQVSCQANLGFTTVTAHLRIDADRDPLIASRVLHRFAERGEVPQRFSARIEGPDRLRIELEFSADVSQARQLSRRLQNLPSVHAVALTFRHNIVRTKENLVLAQSA